MAGAFGDCAVLLPLLAILSMKSGMSSPLLFATAGLAYLASAAFFKIPISVQPLKSITIAAVAWGASAAEIRWSAAFFAVICVLLAFGRWDRWALKIPASLVHGIQFALGVLLVMQGAHSVWILAMALALIGVSDRSRDLPLLGGVALIGLVFGSFHPVDHHELALRVPHEIRLSVIAFLLLPQLALTFANSVIGTADVAARYYGEKARRVNPRNLLFSIGLGNLVTASVGGLPFCHGAGGLTAQFRAGARDAWSNGVIGGALLFFAAFQFYRGGLVATYSPMVLGVLLCSIGIFHLRLAGPTWDRGLDHKAELIAVGVTSALTENLLAALVVGIACEVIRAQIRMPRRATS